MGNSQHFTLLPTNRSSTLKSLQTKRSLCLGNTFFIYLNAFSEKRPFTAANPLMNPGIVQ
jgi:hypothetical protein